MNLTVLGADGARKIDGAARSILERTGVEIPHEEMLGLFVKAGARVDASKSRVRIPPGLVDDCLRSAGKTFTLYGRDQSRRAAFGAGKRNYNSTAGEAFWIEGSGKRRFARLEDVVEAARIGNVLPRIDIVGAMSDPHEIDVSYRCVEAPATLFRTTTKPVMFWFHDRASAAYVLEVFSTPGPMAFPGT